MQHDKDCELLGGFYTCKCESRQIGRPRINPREGNTEARLAAAENEARYVLEELHSAIRKHPVFNSPHEGWAVIKEEEEELWDEVKRRDIDVVAMRKEAIQVAAMAIRFLTDCCPGPRFRKPLDMTDDRTPAFRYLDVVTLTADGGKGVVTGTFQNPATGATDLMVAIPETPLAIRFTIRQVATAWLRKDEPEKGDHRLRECYRSWGADYGMGAPENPEFEIPIP